PPKPADKEPAAPQAKAPTSPPGPATVAGPTPTTGGETEEATAPEDEEEGGEGEEAGRDGARSSPLVRRIAKEHGVDLSALAGRGTGINGRITKRDILSYIEQGGEKKTVAARLPSQTVSRPAPAAPAAPAPPPPAPPPMTFTGDVERVPLTAMRKAIAEHMVMSRRTSAHVTTLFEVDCSRILKAKEKQQAEFERSGVRLTVTPFFVQAAATALKRFPIV